MFSKCLVALVVAGLTTVALFAEEFKGALFVKYDEKEGATFKIPDETDKDKTTEKTFKVDGDATIKMKKENVKLIDQFPKEKAGRKYDLTIKDGVITEAKRQKGK